MQRIILMRHAKSDWSQPGQHDKERSLNDRGRSAAPRMANWLASLNYTIGQVRSSSSTRTRETWALMSPILEPHLLKPDDSPKPLDTPPPVQFLDELYLGSANELWKQVIAFFDSAKPAPLRTEPTLMILAHNPGLELLVRALANQEVEFPTSAIAIFERSGSLPIEDLISSVDNGEWNLVNLKYPKQLVD